MSKSARSGSLSDRTLLFFSDQEGIRPILVPARLEASGPLQPHVLRRVLFCTFVIFLTPIFHPFFLHLIMPYLLPSAHCVFFVRLHTWDFVFTSCTISNRELPLHSFQIWSHG